MSRSHCSHLPWKVVPSPNFQWIWFNLPPWLSAHWWSFFRRSPGDDISPPGFSLPHVPANFHWWHQYCRWMKRVNCYSEDALAKGQIAIQLERMQMNLLWWQWDLLSASHAAMQELNGHSFIISSSEVLNSNMVRFPLTWFLSCCEGFDMHHILTVCICYSDRRFCSKQ
jgi:hypothetical protein